MFIAEKQRELTYPQYLSEQIAALHLADQPAVSWSGETLTYEELSGRANRLANYLRSLGAGPESLIGVYLEPGFNWVIAILAIWKAGAAYLPLDPTYPSERLTWMLGDGKPDILLTETRWLLRLQSHETMVFSLDDPFLQNALMGCPVEPPASMASPHDLAYVIYTSGSTGQPNGVEITQRALLNHNVAIGELFGLCRGERVLQFASPSFDVSLEELFPSWLCGCTVVLRTSEVLGSIRQFLSFVARERISVLNLPTAYWHQLVEELPSQRWPESVRLVVIGGERASDQAYVKWKKAIPDSVTLFNAYGPTEAAITALVYTEERKRDSLSIGTPLPNCCAIILDECLEPVSPGSKGELFLGGVGLARGYRSRPELTARRFIPNPFPQLPSKRLYRTGDLARLSPDGNLEFIGRTDEQVKIRGFRIEPGEVESALLHCPFVAEAVVLAQEDEAGHKKLAAYYVARPPHLPAASDLMHFLRNKIPSYAVPSAFIALAQLPHTPGGKVDRMALLRTQQTRPTVDGSYLRPRTRLQEELAAIWREVLRLQQVGVHDNFLELGGDSLQALQVISRIRERFGVELPLTSFFEASELEELTARLEAARPAAPPDEPEPGLRAGIPPASFIQEQLWVAHELNPCSDSYNVMGAYLLKGAVEYHRLQRALDMVINRHDALRTKLLYMDGRLVQCVSARMFVPMALLSATGLRRRTELHRRVQAEAQRPFDLTRGPLIRVALFRVRATEHVLVIAMHHIISDGWSLAILFHELEWSYSAFGRESTPRALPELDLQYADFARWQRIDNQGAKLEAQKAFWKEALDGAPLEIHWPKETPSERKLPDGLPQARRQSIALPAPQMVRGAATWPIRELTPFMLLLASLALSLHEWTGQEDLVIGTVVAGRTRRQFEDVIGCFMNFLPLRLDLRRAGTGRRLLELVKTVVLEAQAHQHCPFKDIIASAGASGQQKRNPLFNVALLWHNYPNRSFAPAALVAEPICLAPQSPLLDLRFEAEPGENEWALACEADSSLFLPKTVSSLLGSFRRIYTRLVKSPEESLRQIEIESAAGSRLRFWPGWLARNLKTAA